MKSFLLNLLSNDANCTNIAPTPLPINEKISYSSSISTSNNEKAQISDEGFLIIASVIVLLIIGGLTGIIYHQFYIIKIKRKNITIKKPESPKLIEMKIVKDSSDSSDNSESSSSDDSETKQGE